MGNEKPKPKTKAQRQKAADELDKALDADKVACDVCGRKFGAAIIGDHKLLAHGQ
jgi:hypothetical protein